MPALVAVGLATMTGLVLLAWSTTDTPPRAVRLPTETLPSDAASLREASLPDNASSPGATPRQERLSSRETPSAMPRTVGVGQGTHRSRPSAVRAHRPAGSRPTPISSLRSDLDLDTYQSP
jgi:hypothetical protein